MICLHLFKLTLLFLLLFYFLFYFWWSRHLMCMQNFKMKIEFILGIIFAFLLETLQETKKVSLGPAPRTFSLIRNVFLIGPNLSLIFTSDYTRSYYVSNRTFIANKTAYLIYNIIILNFVPQNSLMRPKLPMLLLK